MSDEEAVENVRLWRDMMISDQEEIPSDEVTDLDLEERELIVSISTVLSSVAELERPCVWSYDDVHGKWDGACGIGWYFFESDETPTGHGMNYCPRCQHPITEEPTEGSELWRELPTCGA